MLNPGFELIFVLYVTKTGLSHWYVANLPRFLFFLMTQSMSNGFFELASSEIGETMIFLTGLETTHESIFSFFHKSKMKMIKINICCIRCIWKPPSPPLSVCGGLDDVGFLGKPNSLTSLESQDEPPAEGRGRCLGDFHCASRSPCLLPRR